MEQNTKNMIEEEELNSKLIDYIRNQLKRGFTIELIRNKLIESGHDLNTIAKCINKIELYRKKKFNMRNIVIFIFLIIILAGIGSYFLLGDRYYLKKGVSLFDQGNYEEALEQFNKAIELNPKNYIAHNYVGLVYFELRAYDQAIEYFNKAIELKPNRFMAHNRLGICYYQQKKYDLAIEQFNKAIELNPDRNSIAFKLLDQTYSQLGQDKLAEAQLNKTGVLINESLLETPCYFSVWDSEVYYFLLFP